MTGSRRGKPYTRDDIAEIRQLVKAGFNYRQIAEKIGRSRSSVQVVMMKAGRGQLAFKIADLQAIDTQIIADLDSGKPAKQVAEALGWTIHRVLMRALRARRSNGGGNDG